MEQFDIKFYFSQFKAIIPHHDINGNLVGIRGRGFLNKDVENGMKYMPIKIQKLMYKYPTSFNLYGLFHNQSNIKEMKRVIVFESEKAVMLYGSMFGQNNNISVASVGMNMSLHQRDLLFDLGVEEVTIAFDKQYKSNYIYKKNTPEYREFERYIRRLIKIVKMFLGYCKISLVLSWSDELGYKDAPIDCGKDTFETLYRERYLVSDISELEDLIS